MAVLLKRKTVQLTATGTDIGIPLSDVNQDLTERQTKALIDAGILPDNKPKKVWRSAKHFSVGDRVVVIAEGFDWVKFWKPGDTGIVQRTWPGIAEARHMDPGQGAVEVLLDSPRIADHALCVFKHRHIDKQKD